MNKYGKGNALYIILIPVILIIVVIITDTVINYTQHKTYKEVTERIVKEVVDNPEIPLENYYEGIKRAYERRGYETERLLVEVDEYSMYLENEHSYFGLITSLKTNGEEFEVTLFGIEYFTFKLRKNNKTFVKVNITYDENNELVFEYTK